MQINTIFLDGMGTSVTPKHETLPLLNKIIYCSVHLRDRNRALGSDQQCEFSTRVSAMQAVAGTPLYVLRLTDALPNSRLDSNGNRCRFVLLQVKTNL